VDESGGRSMASPRLPVAARRAACAARVNAATQSAQAATRPIGLTSVLPQAASGAPGVGFSPGTRSPARRRGPATARSTSQGVAPGDGRARSVVVTDQGRRLIAALDRQMNRRLGAWLAAKPRPAIDRLADGLAAAFGSHDARIAIRSPRPGAIGHIIARHGEF